MRDITKYKGQPNNPEEKKGFIRWIRERLFHEFQNKIDQANRLAEAKVNQEEEKARSLSLDNMDKELEIEKKYHEFIKENPRAEIIRSRANTLDQDKLNQIDTINRKELVAKIFFFNIS